MWVDGGRYHIVPAELDPGGGFCVTLDRDFEGETNMSSMLYLRRVVNKRESRSVLPAKVHKVGCHVRLNYDRCSVAIS